MVDRELRTDCEFRHHDDDERGHVNFTLAKSGEQPQGYFDEFFDAEPIPSGSLALRRTVVRIDDLIAAAWQRLRPTAIRKQLSVCIHARRGVYRDAPVLSCDEDLLLQVLLQLIGSAIREAPAGGHIFVTSWSTDDEIGVSLRASRPGRTDVEIVRVVEPSCVPKRDVRREHGLHSVHSVILAHGGQLSIKGDPGRGTCHTVMLPRWHAA